MMRGRRKWLSEGVFIRGCFMRAFYRVRGGRGVFFVCFFFFGAFVAAAGATRGDSRYEVFPKWGKEGRKGAYQGGTGKYARVLFP